MATWTFEGYMGSGPSWTDLGSNILVFSGSLTDITATVEVGHWQDGTHAGSDHPGTDQCGANHMNNVKYISATEMSVNGGATENINDTNLAENECTARWHFNHSSAVKMQNMKLFVYDGSDESNPAPEVEMQAFERGVGATSWTEINDYSAGVGGSGSAMSLGDKDTAATDHYFYLALSWSPESAGPKQGAKLKIQGEYY